MTLRLERRIRPRHRVLPLLIATLRFFRWFDGPSLRRAGDEMWSRSDSFADALSDAAFFRVSPTRIDACWSSVGSIVFFFQLVPSGRLDPGWAVLVSVQIPP